MFTRTVLIVASALAILIAAAPATAQTAYPEKSIRIIVGVAAGGGLDRFARLTADKLTKAWGKPVVVENRVGASGAIGSEYVAKSPPDGYTLLMASINTHGANPGLFGPKLPYDAVKDFAPVIFFVSTTNLLVVDPRLPIHSLKDLLAMARAKPGGLTYGSAGSGSSLHLFMEQLKIMAKVDITHVPYKGAAPALMDVIGGQISMSFDSMGSALPQAQAGKVRAIAVNGSKRSAAAPDVPTLAESGLPGFDFISWAGVVAPAGTPPQIVNKLNAEINRMLRMPDVKQSLAAVGATPVGGSPEEFAAFIRKEVATWKEMVRITGARVD